MVGLAVAITWLAIWMLTNVSDMADGTAVREPELRAK
jgi:hypothetical protein